MTGAMSKPWYKKHPHIAAYMIHLPDRKDYICEKCHLLLNDDELKQARVIAELRLRGNWGALHFEDRQFIWNTDESNSSLSQ